MKHLIQRLEELKTDYGYLKSDFQNIGGIKNICFLVDSNELYNYVFINDSVSEFSYSEKDNFVNNVVLHNSILEVLLFKNQLNVSMFPGHKREYNALREALITQEISLLKESIDLAKSHNDRTQNDFLRIAQKIESIEMDFEDSFASSEFGEVLAELMNIAGPLISLSLNDRMSPKNRHKYLVSNLRMTSFQDFFGFTNSFSDGSSAIEDRAFKEFEKLRPMKHSANRFDAQVFSTLYNLKSSNHRMKIVVISRAETFHKVALKLTKDTGHDFTSYFRHPRYLMALIDHSYDLNKIKKVVEQRFWEFADAYERLTQNNSQNQNKLSDILDKEEIRSIEMNIETGIESYEKKLVALQFYSSHIDMNQFVDADKLLALLKDKDVLLREIALKANETFAEISASYIQTSAQYVGMIDAKEVSKDVDHATFKASQKLINCQNDLFLIDRIFLADSLVPISIAFPNNIATKILSHNELTSKEFSNLFRENKLQNQVLTGVYFRLYQALFFGMVCQWEAASAFCDWAVKLSAKSKSKIETAEAHYFRALCRRNSENTLSGDAIARSLTDLQQCLSIYSELKNCPARYLMELASQIATAEFINASIKTDILESLNIPLDAADIWLSLLDRNNLTLTEHIIILNRLCYYYYKKKNWSAAVTYAEKIKSVLTVNDISLFNLPANILHTLIVAMDCSSVPLNKNTKTNLRNVWRSVRKKPLQAAHFEHKDVLSDIKNILS